MPLLTDVIKGIRQTEKGAKIQKLNQYMLDVDADATKPQIKQAVEAQFKVTVRHVNTQKFQGKWRRLTGRWGRRTDWKRAIITVNEGQKIEFK
jgi:large subunit ribosomal protein L23